MNIRPEPLAYTVAAFCKAMSLGKTKVFEMIRTGEIRSKIVGGRRLIPAEEIQRLLR
jgi:excisionase family DNA binding protein